MFKLAAFLGIYSYLIFFLGIFGLLYKEVIVFSSLIYFCAAGVYFRVNKIKLSSKVIKFDKYSKIIITLLLIQALINVLGALGPEIAFDALWYHLTLPKIYLQNHSIIHIPGNLLYYSDMPKNIEMLFIPALLLNGEVIVKLISFTFGLISLAAIYKLSREFLSKNYSLLSTLIFYSNLVVGWQSITSYVDLGRTLFEIISLIQFYLWVKTKSIIYLVCLSIVVGLSISTKLGAFNSFLIFLILILLINFKNKVKIKNYLKDLSVYTLISLLIPMPWFIFAIINTGNPVYPLFTNILSLSYNRQLFDLLKVFIFASDPISPLYLILVPLFIFDFKKFNFELKILTFYSVLGLIMWYINSTIGGTRYLMPYLPAFSILGSFVIFQTKPINLRKFLICLVIFLSIVSISYRAVANYKYLPVILGQESKHEFLTRYLNFSFGDFYDTDNYFKNNLKKNDKVLLYGFHNLYYVDFPYIDSSWVKKGDRFNMIAIQNSSLPEKFSDWNKIYYNQLTKVTLYSKENKVWDY